MKVCVYTLGCKVNQYDSDSIIARLLKKYDVTDKMEKADVYVINTCAVTAEAERKSRQIMQRAKSLNPDAKILVIGCASQNNPKQFWDKGADFVSGTANKIAICDFENLSGLLRNYDLSFFTNRHSPCIFSFWLTHYSASSKV